MKKTIRYSVSGRVQGVGFRFSAQDKATELGLSGWVMNRLNGDVEGIIQGDPENLQRFVDWLWNGPKYAAVTAVQCQEISHEPIIGFQIMG